MVKTVRTVPRPGDRSLEDLAGYRVKVRVALARLIGAIGWVSRPRADGLTVLRLLGILARFPPLDPNAPLAVHRFTEARRLA